MFIAEISGGALEFITLFILRISNTELKNQATIYNGALVIDLHGTKFQMSNRLYFYLLIFVCTCFDFVTINGIFIVCLMVGMFNLPIQMRIIQIIFTGILCYLILKTFMYIHQILSCFFIIIGLVLINYSTFTVVLDSMVVLVSVIGFDLLLSCQEVFEKYVILNMGISVYRLLFVEGLFGVALTIIGFVCANNITCSWDFCGGESNKVENVSLMLNSINWRIGVYLFLFYLASIGLNIFAMLTNYCFTPTHRSVAYTFHSCFWWMLMLIIQPSSQNSTSSFILQIIGYVLMIIGSLIYNEIIILGCFSLDQYTREVIMQRAQLETEIELMIDNDDKCLTI